MSGYWALRRAVTDALDAEIGDDVVALRRMLMDALAPSSPEHGDVDRYVSILEADQAASVAHDFIWGLNGVTQQQASDAIWVIHNALRPLIVRAGDDVAGNLEGDAPIRSLFPPPGEGTDG